MTLLQSWFWPNVSSRKNALFAISEAFWVLLAVAAFQALLTFVNFARTREPTDSLLGFVDAALLAGIAVGISCKSRTAAVAGFVLYLADRATQIMLTGRPGGIALTFLVALALLHGVRGTFAFHRFAPIPEGTPSIEDSFRSFGHSQQPTQREPEPK